MRNILLFMLCASFAHAMGQTVDNFDLLNVVNQQNVSIKNYASSPGLVLVFTSNDCPYDEYYRQRIGELSSTYAGRIPVLMVNAHTDPDESREKMAAKAKEWNLKSPYLADKAQTLAGRLNVRKSPEAFVLKNQKGKFAVVYRGAIDDNAQVAGDVRHYYLRDAIDAVLNNTAVATPEVRPVGCNLKKAQAGKP